MFPNYQKTPALENDEDLHPNSEDPSTTSPISDSGSRILVLPDCEKYACDNLNNILPNGELAIPHVLVSLALEGEQLLEIGAWDKWLKECPAFIKFAQVEGMYKSHSTLLLLSLPVVIWDLLPDDFACSFVAYVESTNYLTANTCKSNPNLQIWLKQQEREMTEHLEDFSM